MHYSPKRPQAHYRESYVSKVFSFLAVWLPRVWLEKMVLSLWSPPVPSVFAVTSDMNKLLIHEPVEQYTKYRIQSALLFQNEKFTRGLAKSYTINNTAKRHKIKPCNKRNTYLNFDTYIVRQAMLWLLKTCIDCETKVLAAAAVDILEHSKPTATEEQLVFFS